MKVKIIFDANPLVLPKSGVGHFTHELVQSLAVAHPEEVALTGHYFNFLGAKKPAGLPHALNIEYRTTRLFPTKLLNLLRRFGLQLPLEFFIRQKADVVLFTNYGSLPTLRKPLRMVVVHDLGFVDCPQFIAAGNRSFLRKWVPYSIRHSDVILTISEFTKQRIAQEYGVPEGRIHVVPIPPGKMPEPDDKVIGRLGLSGGYMLFVGTIEPRKNILGLVEAYDRLPAELSKRFPLVLAGGKGWNDETTLARIEELRAKGLRIIQTGYVSNRERTALFRHATLCVQPSHYEGFGMPILEAMAEGKPVICSDLAVFHEVAGDVGVFFDQNDPDSIAAAMTRVLKDPELQQKMGKAGKDRVASYKTWASIADDLYELIARMLKNSR